MKTQRCSIRLAPRLENLSVLERFIARCRFLGPDQTSRAMLLATECFDNIVEHGRGFSFCRVSIGISRSIATKIVLRYRARNFDEAIKASRSIEPYYDAVSRRYRGLGLLMCRNLSLSIIYKKGLFKSSIVIIL